MMQHRLSRLDRLPPDAFTPHIQRMRECNAGEMTIRVGSRRRARLDLRFKMKEGDLFITNALTKHTVRATSPGPRARLLAEVAAPLAYYEACLANLRARDVVEELYDLKTDPAQQHNLLAAVQDKRKSTTTQDATASTEGTPDAA